MKPADPSNSQGLRYSMIPKSCGLFGQDHAARKEEGLDRDE
jgi:hypothetical protein